MNNQEIQVTRKGFEALKSELDDLVVNKRPKTVERLERARQEGDLRENSDYIDAKEELEFLDGRIDELKHVVDHAQIIEPQDILDGQVSLGTLVTLDTDGVNQEFEIVGEWEADPMKKRISPKSPLGSKLVGKQVGDVVDVEAPAGTISYKILDVKSLS